MKNKKGYEFSFAWIFAILVGAVVIFLAVYSAVKFAGVFNFQQGTESGKEIGVLLTPFEASLETGKTNLIITREETSIFNDCTLNGEFGEQIISVSVDSRIGSKDVIGARNSFKDRYLFSKSKIQGKEFYLLSKPFEFPFKIGDLIIAWGEKDKYCFVDALPKVKEDIKNLNLKNIANVSSTNDCKEDQIRVCFERDGECDIVVNAGEKSVEHEDEEVYYADVEGNGLMYAAIFTDPKVYNCQIRRLMKRASNLVEINKAKSEYLGERGCSAPRLNSYFMAYSTQVNSVISSNNPDIRNVEPYSEDLGRENDLLICEIF